MKKQLSYLALGDSYTIGEAVEQRESFPYQLADQLRTKGLDIDKPIVIAKTGWTTSELKSAIEVENLSQRFNFVTLLIGVNNQYRSESSDDYREEFKALLKTAIEFADHLQSHVFVISIPDWGVTPFGKDSGRGVSQIAAEIDVFNNINRELASELGVNYIDITPESRLALTDLDLIATDGLHPSGLMYHDWARSVANVALEQLT